MEAQGSRAVASLTDRPLQSVEPHPSPNQIRRRRPVCLDRRDGPLRWRWVDQVDHRSCHPNAPAQDRSYVSDLTSPSTAALGGALPGYGSAPPNVKMSQSGDILR
jgi:hypothetical protein